MTKQLSFSAFQSLPVKVRKSLVCEILSNQKGYLIEGEGKHRDKLYLKALVKFQKSIGLAGNGIICETTFSALSPVYSSNKYPR